MQIRCQSFSHSRCQSCPHFTYHHLTPAFKNSLSVSPAPSHQSTLQLVQLPRCCPRWQRPGWHLHQHRVSQKVHMLHIPLPTQWHPLLAQLQLNLNFVCLVYFDATFLTFFTLSPSWDIPLTLGFWTTHPVCSPQQISKIWSFQVF